ncbi:MAG TPA: energy transducer TonB [Rhodanobacteraceae bacterium]|nr:energy transducer TonB [Rhodanobacteraceae bacterium]
MISQVSFEARRWRAHHFGTAALLAGAIIASAAVQVAAAAPPGSSARSAGSSARSAHVEDADPSLDVASRNANMPTYPVAAFRHGYTGVVLLDVTVDDTGKEISVVVDPKGTNAAPILQTAALDAVKKWKFHPGFKDGRPVGGVVKAPVNFNIETPCPEDYKAIGQFIGPSYSCLAQQSTKSLPAPKCESGFRLVPKSGGSYDCDVIVVHAKKSH